MVERLTEEQIKDLLAKLNKGVEMARIRAEASRQITCGSDWLGSTGEQQECIGLLNVMMGLRIALGEIPSDVIPVQRTDHVITKVELEEFPKRTTNSSHGWKY